MLPEGVTSITMHIDVVTPNRHNLDYNRQGITEERLMSSNERLIAG